MARHTARAILLTVHGTHLRYISCCQAYRLIDAGEALRVTNNRELAAGKQLAVKLRDGRGMMRVVATLTRRDMERNAEAVAEHRNCRSRDKVDAWTSVHDTFAVTVTGGKVFIPDPAEAAARGRKQAPK